MGCNTIHNKSEDHIPVKNLTNGAQFKVSYLTKESTNRVELVVGLEKNSTNLGIICHGYCDVSVDDVVMILNQKMRVVGTNVEYDPLQLKRRVDLKNCTSSVEMVLR